MEALPPYLCSFGANPAEPAGERRDSPFRQERFSSRAFSPAQSGRKEKAMTKKKQKYVCKTCGAELRWRSREELVDRVYPEDGRLRDKGEVVNCELTIECSKDDTHDCGFECDDFEHVTEKARGKTKKGGR